MLAWSSLSDLDIYVTCPSGETIWARQLNACGGALDIDANGSGNAKVPDPVEHVTFPVAPPGTYRVAVANCEYDGPSEAFRITVIHRGRVIHRVPGGSPVTRSSGTAGCGTPRQVLEFRIPP